MLTSSEYENHQASREIAHRRLVQIADALGVPAEHLFDDAAEDEGLSGTSELLKLWLTLRSPKDRLALLDHVRWFSMIQDSV